MTSGYIGSDAFTAQVLVDYATVTIKNIGVDANAAAGPCFPAGRWIGIAYRNSGGTIRNLFVRNGPECANATTIYADTPSGLKIRL